MSDGITVLYAALSASPQVGTRPGLVRRRALLLACLLLPLACSGADDPAGPSFAIPMVTTVSLADAMQNVAYSETLIATGGDGSYAWELATDSLPLPTGLSLEKDGDITGTPTVVGSWDFRVEVTSASRTGMAEFSIAVLPNSPGAGSSRQPNY